MIGMRVAALAAGLLGLCSGTSVAGQVIAASDFDSGPQGWTFSVSAEWRAICRRSMAVVN